MMAELYECRGYNALCDCGGEEFTDSCGLIIIDVPSEDAELRNVLYWERQYPCNCVSLHVIILDSECLSTFGVTATVPLHGVFPFYVFGCDGMWFSVDNMAYQLVGLVCVRVYREKVGSFK